MDGRSDVILTGICAGCMGKGIDHKNRKRVCPKCYGSGKKRVCTTCGEDMPCSGTYSDIMDQSRCGVR